MVAGFSEAFQKAGVTQGPQKDKLRLPFRSAPIRDNFFYFLKLPEQFDSFETFKDAWRYVSRQRDKENLLSILENVTFHIGKEDTNVVNHDERIDCLTFISRNVRAWEGPFLSRAIRDCSKDELLMVMGYFAELGIRPTNNFMREWYRNIREKMSEFRCADVQFAIRSIARLALTPPDKFMNRITALVKSEAPALTEPRVHGLIWGMTIIDSYSRHNLKESVKILYELTQNNRTDNTYAARIRHNSALWFDFSDQETFLLHENDKISSSEIRLKKTLEASGIKLKHDFVCRALHHRPDIVLAEKKDIFIELDGKDHFVFEDGRIYYDGPTLFQTQLLAKAVPGSIVLRLPYTAAESLINEENFYHRDIMANQLHEMVIKAEPGAYRLRANTIDDNFTERSALFPLLKQYG